MAFKIKSAKIFLSFFFLFVFSFFWNKRTHSDVVVGSNVILAQAGPLQGVKTGRGYEAFSILHPASGDGLLTKEGQSVTAVRRLEEARLREGEAAGVGHRKNEGLPDGVTAVGISCKRVLAACPVQEEACVSTV